MFYRVRYKKGDQVGIGYTYRQMEVRNGYYIQMWEADVCYSLGSLLKNK